MNEILAHIPVSERATVEKRGAVLIIVDPTTHQIAYGRQIRDNGRGVVNEIGINGESYEPKDTDIMFSLSRLVTEELGVNGDNVLVRRDNFAEHYLGEVWFGEDKKIMAYVFWAFGDRANFTSEESGRNSTGPEDDFELIGFTEFNTLLSMEGVRPRMRHLIETLNENRVLNEFINSREIISGTSLVPLNEFIHTYFHQGKI